MRRVGSEPFGRIPEPVRRLVQPSRSLFSIEPEARLDAGGTRKTLAVLEKRSNGRAPQHTSPPGVDAQSHAHWEAVPSSDGIDGEDWALADEYTQGMVVTALRDPGSGDKAPLPGRVLLACYTVAGRRSDSSSSFVVPREAASRPRP